MNVPTSSSLFRSQRDGSLLVKSIPFISPYLYLEDIESLFLSCKLLYEYSKCLDGISELHSNLDIWKRYYTKRKYAHMIKSLHLYDVKSDIDLLDVLRNLMKLRSQDQIEKIDTGLSHISIHYGSSFKSTIGKEEILTEFIEFAKLRCHGCTLLNSVRSFSLRGINLRVCHVEAFTTQISASLRSLHLSGIVDWPQENISCLLNSMPRLEYLHVDNFRVAAVCLPSGCSSLKTVVFSHSLSPLTFELRIENPSVSISSELDGTDSLALTTQPSTALSSSSWTRSQLQLQLQHIDCSYMNISPDSVCALLNSQRSLHTLILKSCRSLKRTVEFRSSSLRVLSLAASTQLRILRLDCPVLEQLDVNQCFLLEEVDFLSSCTSSHLRAAKLSLTKLPIETLRAALPYTQITV